MIIRVKTVNIGQVVYADSPRIATIRASQVTHTTPHGTQATNVFLVNGGSLTVDMTAEDFDKKWESVLRQEMNMQAEITAVHAAKYNRRY